MQTGVYSDITHLRRVDHLSSQIKLDRQCTCMCVLNIYAVMQSVHGTSVICCVHPTTSSDHADLLGHNQMGPLLSWFKHSQSLVLNWATLFHWNDLNGDIFNLKSSFLLSSQQKLNNDRYACRNTEETESALVRHRNHSLTALSHLPHSAPLSPSVPQANFSSTIHYIVTIIR